MSGIYIKAKMPNECSECPIYDREYLKCNITGTEPWRRHDGESIDISIPIPSDCPIVQVPDHGDLIDKEALLQEFYKAQKSYDDHGRGFSDAFMVGNEICAEWWAVECKVEDAPVIIPTDLDGET